MEWRQLLCITACVLELAGCAAESTTDTPTATATAVTARDSSSGTASTVSAATGDTSNAKTTSAGATTGPVATNSASSELLGQLGTSSQASPATTSPPDTPLEPHRSTGVSTTQSPPGTQPEDRAHTAAPTVARTSSAGTPEHPAVPAGTTALPTARHSPTSPLPAIGCHGARGEGDTGAICLQLNESSTCEQFLGTKGSDLWQAICKNRTHTVESPCEIKLTPSSLDRDCLLLILTGEKDPDKLLNTLQKSPWEKFGIEALKKESTRRHREPSQKTLITLVTSGLLLAFLGLAGYFLMKRRSWSPAGQRLAEDPYYTEHGSQGNTLLMTPSQEPAELQEKPNLPSLNGATQENGTGQATSKNGHSGRQHSPADTEM